MRPRYASMPFLSVGILLGDRFKLQMAAKSEFLYGILHMREREREREKERKKESERERVRVKERQKR